MLISFHIILTPIQEIMTSTTSILEIKTLKDREVMLAQFRKVTIQSKSIMLFWLVVPILKHKRCHTSKWDAEGGVKKMSEIKEWRKLSAESKQSLV